MIFIHSSFRTGSTYIWSHLRKSRSTIAYYEVFNEALHQLQPENVGAWSPTLWDSRHPPGSPYFFEFLPLLKEGGGLEGLDPSMSYERFIPAGGCDGSVSSGEASHIGRLIRHAEARGRIPVLTSTRSLGRVRGLKRSAPGLHVLLYRNLFQQWCSISQQVESGNPYFFDRLLDCVRLGRHDPILDDLQRVFPLDGASIEKPSTFSIFALLHLHLYVQSVGAADLVIDLNRLESNPAHRQAVERVFAGQNVDVNFSDVKNATTYSRCPLGTARELQERLKVLGDMILDHAPDTAGREFGETVLSDLIVEYDRHEFYASGSRKTLVELLELSLSRDHLRQQMAVVSAERDALQQQGDEARHSNAQLQNVHNTTLAELEQVRQQLSVAVAACTISAAERETALREKDAVRLDRDAAVAALDRLKIERDQFLAWQQGERNEWNAARADSTSRITRLQAEVAEQEAAARLVQDQAQAAQADLRAERDRALAGARLAFLERDDQQTLNRELSQARAEAVADRDRNRAWSGQLAARIRELEQEIDLLVVGWSTGSPGRLGRKEPAWFTIMQAVRQRPTPWRQVADRARDLQDWPRAARAYGHYLELQPSDHAIWVQYGHALKEAGTLQCALAAYRESQRLQPADDDRDTHLLDLQRRLTLDPPGRSDPVGSTSSPQLLVTTTTAAWVLDTGTGQAFRIHQGCGVYYGITFSEDTLFIACRNAAVGAERATQNNVILCFDRDLVQREVLTAPWPIRDVHQIFYHDGTLYICATYDDVVLEYDVVLRSWRRWHPFGDPDGAPDQHHINSILVDRDGILLAGNAPEGWAARFGRDRVYLEENRCPIGLGTHNVWRERGKMMVCSSTEGGIRSEDHQLRIVQEHGWVRGVASVGRETYVGVSQNLVRDAREQSDCSVLRIEAAGAVSRCHTFQTYGMLHDLRVLGRADSTHNGIEFRLTERALDRADLVYMVSPAMLSL